MKGCPKVLISNHIYIAFILQMVQVTGNLKVHISDSDSQADRDSQKSVIGFVGECRLIESTASILEISIPQSYFTTTISMDMKIVSVESQ